MDRTRKLTALDMLSDEYDGGDDTVEQLIERWDAGNLIQTVEMGGLGPGYEQAIQIMAIEFARALSKSEGYQDKDMSAENKRVSAICDTVMATIDKQIGGATGAMYGAAKNLAWKWCYEGGPRKILGSVDATRRISCSKHYPSAEKE